MTSAEAHDPNIFEEILTANKSKDAWVDSAYPSEEHELTLELIGCCNHAHKNRKRDQPSSKPDKQASKRRSHIRVRDGHVFESTTNEQGTLHFTVIGITRNTAKVGIWGKA